VSEYARFVGPSNVMATEAETPPRTRLRATRKAAEGVKAFEELYQRHNRRVYTAVLRDWKRSRSRRSRAGSLYPAFGRSAVSRRVGLHHPGAPLTVNQVLLCIFTKRGVRLGRRPKRAVPVHRRKEENPNAMPVVDRIASIRQSPVTTRYPRFYPATSRGMNTRR
jgi:hypothetical protein